MGIIRTEETRIIETWNCDECDEKNVSSVFKCECCDVIYCHKCRGKKDPLKYTGFTGCLCANCVDKHPNKDPIIQHENMAENIKKLQQEKYDFAHKHCKVINRNTKKLRRKLNP